MKLWKCTICNYIHEGDEPPDECPVCGADKSAFVEVSGDEMGDTSSATDSAEASKNISSVAGATRRWKCTVCDYIHEGAEPPDVCPVCGADKSFFVEITTGEKEAETSSPSLSQPAGVEQVVQQVVEQPPYGFLGKLIEDLHLHPISVHTPNGVLPIAFLFLLGGIYFNYAALEVASFFNLIFVLLSMPLVHATGYVTWKRKYRGAKTWVFTTKIVCSAIVTLLVSILVFWRFIDHGVALAGTTMSWVYLGISGAILVAAGIAGHLGGKLVFGK